jgi:hypothetical protein
MSSLACKCALLEEMNAQFVVIQATPAIRLYLLICGLFDHTASSSDYSIQWWVV